MGVNHDKFVLDWTKSVSTYTSNEETDTETGCACDWDITDGNDVDDIDVDDIDVDDIDVDDIDVIPEEECDIPTDRSLFIIGDNWDKIIKPRADMRMNNPQEIVIDNQEPDFTFDFTMISQMIFFINNHLTNRNVISYCRIFC